MLSLAISSLGKQAGGRWRKIIWTFGLAMDPLPPRGVRGAGQGDSLGQYSGAGGGSCSGEGVKGGSHKGELEWVALADKPALRWSLQKCWGDEACECAGNWGGSDSCWRCQLRPGVHTHTHTHKQYKLMTGGVEVLKGVTAMSGSVPPCPLLPTSSLLRHSEGMAHHTRLTPEILSYRYSVSVWQRVCDSVCASSYEWGSYWYDTSVMCLCVYDFLCVWAVTICVMELLTSSTWTRTTHWFLETQHLHASQVKPPRVRNATDRFVGKIQSFQQRRSRTP